MEDVLRTGLSNALTAALMGAVVATLSPLLSRRPAVLHALWALVLLKLVTPPLFEIPVGRFETEPAAVGIERPAPAENVEFEPLDWGWLDAPEIVTFQPEVARSEPPEIEAASPWRLLGWVWLTGAVATVLIAGSRILRFHRRLRDVAPAGAAVEAEVAALAAGMGLRRAPRVDVVDARVPPMVWSLGARPRLILPRSLWNGLDARRRTLLLTHELAHLKRGDHRLRWLELTATVLYWWLPVVWWTRRALRDVEEQCCDAWVVWMFPDDARAYAETLLDAVDFLTPDAPPAPLLASGFGKARHLRRRLTMVMQGKTPRTLGWTGSLGALALAGVLLPLGPAWAQKAPEGEQALTVTFKAVDDEKDKAEGRRAREGDQPEGRRAREGDQPERRRDREGDQPEGRRAREGDDPFKADHERPEFAAARKKVEELQKDLVKKQRAMAEAARKLVAAQQDLARIGGDLPFGPGAGFGGPFRGFGPMGPMGPMTPRIAEGRAILRGPERSEEKARIDALEKKLDEVLKRLEERNKSEDDGEK